MCFGALFASPKKKRKSSHSASEEKAPSQERGSRHYQRTSVVAQASKHSWSERPDVKPSKETYTRADRRMRPTYLPNSGARQRPTLTVNVPPMWHRRAGSTSSNSSEEMLLNPRPERSAHDKRHHHARHTSQSTLRGRGAKRQRTSDSRRDDHASAHASPRTPKKKSQARIVGDSPRSNYSNRHTQQHHYHSIPTEPQPGSSRSRPHSSRHAHQHPSARANTGARRDAAVDRRFAVLAATNSALENLRHEAFSQPSPPPPPRLRRYQGVQIPASSIPFEWDCISSQTQSSARHGEGSARRRPRR